MKTRNLFSVKKNFSFFKIAAAMSLLISGAFLNLNAQVTIGSNAMPSATLDVVASNATSATVAEGVIAPRLTLAQLQNKDGAYTTNHAGVIVYVTDVTGSPAGKTINVKIKGYYYFDGSVWKGFASSSHVTLNNLQESTYVTNNGDIVYVTNITGEPGDDSKTVNITRPGYYYYDTTTNTWVSMTSNDDGGHARVSLTELQDITGAADGDVVYVNNIDGDPADETATVNVSAKGYYYYDATNSVWVSMASNPRVSLANLNNTNNYFKQDGNIVYVETIGGETPAGATINITAPGYYYYDDASGTWKSMNATNPHVTVTELKTTYITKEGDIVYVTNTTGGGVTGEVTENVTNPGYYYYDGTKWQIFGGNSSSSSSSGHESVSLTELQDITGSTNGDVVYVNNIDGNPADETATVNVSATGYYYFENGEWHSMASNPRVSLTTLNTNNYFQQDGNVVYVNNSEGTPDGATGNITAPGYYYFDAVSNTWKSLGGKNKVRFITTSSYTIQKDDDIIFTQHPTAGVALTFPTDWTTAEAGKVVWLYNDNLTVTANSNAGTAPKGSMSWNQARGMAYIWSGYYWYILSK